MPLSCGRLSCGRSWAFNIKWTPCMCIYWITDRWWRHSWRTSHQMLPWKNLSSGQCQPGLLHWHRRHWRRCYSYHMSHCSHRGLKRTRHRSGAIQSPAKRVHESTCGKHIFLICLTHIVTSIPSTSSPGAWDGVVDFRWVFREGSLATQDNDVVFAATQGHLATHVASTRVVQVRQRLERYTCNQLIYTG